MFSARDPTDEEIRFVAEIWRAAASVPIERSLMILMSAVTLLIADSSRPAFFWDAVRKGVEYRCKEQQHDQAPTHPGPVRPQ